MSSLEGFLFDVAFWAIASLVVLLYYARKRHIHVGVLMKYLYGPSLSWMVLASSTRLFIGDSRAQIWVFAALAFLGVLVFRLPPIRRWFGRKILDAQFGREYPTLQEAIRP